MQIYCFVFNSHVLIPWGVVDGVKDEDLLETMLTWHETKREGYKFRDNDEVADINNPRQKMTVRRVIRESYKVGEEMKSKIKGIECYWWGDINIEDVLKVIGIYSERSMVRGSHKVE